MRLFGAAERSGGDSPGCGYRQMFWLVMTVYHYGLILLTPTGWRGVELRGRVQGGVFRDSLGMHPRWSQAPRLLVVESVCVFGVALSSLGFLSARMLIGFPVLFFVVCWNNAPHFSL